VREVSEEWREHAPCQLGCAASGLLRGVSMPLGVRAEANRVSTSPGLDVLAAGKGCGRTDACWPVAALSV
jgi:hypothetical protein